MGPLRELLCVAANRPILPPQVTSVAGHRLTIGAQLQLHERAACEGERTAGPTTAPQIPLEDGPKRAGRRSCVFVLFLWSHDLGVSQGGLNCFRACRSRGATRHGYRGSHNATAQHPLVLAPPGRCRNGCRSAARPEPLKVFSPSSVKSRVRTNLSPASLARHTTQRDIGASNAKCELTTKTTEKDVEHPTLTHAVAARSRPHAWLDVSRETATNTSRLVVSRETTQALGKVGPGRLGGGRHG